MLLHAHSYFIRCPTHTIYIVQYAPFYKAILPLIQSRVKMPKVQFKTITQQSFELDVEESLTIADIKKEIANKKGESEFPVEGQKLIYNGKVLDDSKPISEVNVAPGKSIIVMVIKKQVSKPIATSQGTSAGEAVTGTKAESNEASPIVENKVPVASTTENKQPEVPPEHAKTVENIESMGYPREEVIRALRVAFWDADRAVEYLCNGIPEGLSLNDAAVVEAVDAGDGDGDEGDEETAEGLEFLANSPQFQQLREMVRADPTALPQIVQQIAETNPQLMDMIRNNQEQFLGLLNTEPVGQAGGDVQPGQIPPGGGNVPAAPGGPQRIAIPITPEDRAAINRLTAMGFPEPLVIEAYLACDKNENLAVNYILQRMEEFHGD